MGPLPSYHHDHHDHHDHDHHHHHHHHHHHDHHDHHDHHPIYIHYITLLYNMCIYYHVLPPTFLGVLEPLAYVLSTMQSADAGCRFGLAGYIGKRIHSTFVRRCTTYIRHGTGCIYLSFRAGLLGLI
jgi:hypothetical protein